jgi:hypothetical protein
MVILFIKSSPVIPALGVYCHLASVKAYPGLD